MIFCWKYGFFIKNKNIKRNNFENLQKHVSVIDNVDDVNFNNEPALFYFMNIINDNTDVRIIKTLIDKSDNLDNKTIKDVINSNNSINQSLKNKIVEYVNFKREFNCRLSELNLTKTQLEGTHWVYIKQRGILKEKIQKLERILKVASMNLDKILLGQEGGVQIW